jgi:hypothetical protein
VCPPTTNGVSPDGAPSIEELTVVVTDTGLLSRRYVYN